MMMRWSMMQGSKKKGFSTKCFQNCINAFRSLWAFVRRDVPLQSQPLRKINSFLVSFCLVTIAAFYGTFPIEVHSRASTERFSSVEIANSILASHCCSTPSPLQKIRFKVQLR